MSLVTWLLTHPWSILIVVLGFLTLIGVADWYLPDEDLENPVDTEA